MDTKKPRNGKQLQLWNKLIPDQSYSGEDIEKIAQDYNLGKWTASNMVHYGTKRGYIILDNRTNLYYRSDSKLFTTKVTETNLQRLESVEPSNTQIIKQHWEHQKRVKDEYQTILKRKQELSQELIELEKKEQKLATKITELEQNLEQIIQKL